MNLKPFDCEALLRAVLETNDVFPDPGARKWYIYENHRKDFVQQVREFYSNDIDIHPDLFPYRDDAILALLAEYWESDDIEKLAVRHRLEMEIPPVVAINPTSVLEFLMQSEVSENDTTVMNKDSSEFEDFRGSMDEGDPPIDDHLEDDGQDPDDR